MGDFEQTSSENINKGISRYRREEINEIEVGISFSQKNEEENKKRAFENYGSGKYITDGTIARLIAKPFYYPEYIKLESDKRSFYYGYYGKGTRLVVVLAVTGEVVLKGKRIFGEEAIQLLKDIAINDGMNNEIIFDELSEELQNNEIYSSYFIETQNSTKRKGR